MNLQNCIIPSISDKKVKVCIAIPARDTVYSHFAYCLQALVQYHTQRGIDTFVEFNLGTLVGNQREKLANKAIDQGATHIFYLDSDMMFPKDVCEILLSHKLSIVGCNYSTRSLPFKSVAYSKMYDWESGIDKGTTGLISVDGVGFGCILIETNVFKFIHKPWFPITYTPETDDYLGEDMNFCQKAIKNGEVIAVDCDLSTKIYHLGTSAFLWNKPQVDTDIID